MKGKKFKNKGKDKRLFNSSANREKLVNNRARMNFRGGIRL